MIIASPFPHFCSLNIVLFIADLTSQPPQTMIWHTSLKLDPATFGLGRENVLDETYRKAGKLDATHFASLFDLEASGLPSVVSGALLEGGKSSADIRFEKYKINVYGMSHSGRLNICS